MASQTGTLKFRQSDGAYNELYPKTTIAQVDGLQTQLDSINTSLQNKVKLNSRALLKSIELTNPPEEYCMQYSLIDYIAGGIGVQAYPKESYTGSLATLIYNPAQNADLILGFYKDGNWFYFAT